MRKTHFLATVMSVFFLFPPISPAGKEDLVGAKVMKID